LFFLARGLSPGKCRPVNGLGIAVSWCVHGEIRYVFASSYLN
jgi:hypothetical protein